MAKKAAKIVKKVAKKVAKTASKKAEPDTKKYFKEIKKVGDRIEVKSYNGRVMDFKDMESAISWAKDSL